MSTNPTPPPPRGEDLSPLEAYRSPQVSELRLRTAESSVVPWGFLDLIVVVVSIMGSGILGKEVAARALGIHATDISQLPQHDWMSLILGGGLGSLAGLILSIVWLRLAARATWADMGWSAKGWQSNALMGAASFLVLMLPIFGLQFVLNYFYERLFGPPPQHPLIQRLLDHPDGLAFAISGFTAVVVAPVTEEFLFRAVFQGWLERLVARWSPLPLAPRQAMLSPEIGEAIAPSASTVNRPLLALPILISSIVFALAHWSHGVAWVPLFFFALALGYLYQRTRSLVAPIVLHMSLNASSMLMLLLHALGQQGA